MNNVKKFDETKKALEDFKKQVNYLEEEAQSKLELAGLRSKSYFEAFLKALQTKQLTINKRMAFAIFQSSILGDYKQPIWKSKRRINVIPLCFLVQLYKENLEVKDILTDKQIDIPFTLRGFWSMDRAEKLLNDLITLQIEVSEIVEKQIKLNRKDKRRVKDLNKILQLVESLDIFVTNSESKKLYEVHFDEKIFKVNKKNRKLDMVPLCKMLTSYYVRIINYIQDYEKLLGVNEDKKSVCEIKESLKKFMEKYFVMYMVK